jgi:hypothetical protein
VKVRRASVKVGEVSAKVRGRVSGFKSCTAWQILLVFSCQEEATIPATGSAL